MKVLFVCDPGEAQFVPAIAKHVSKSAEVREDYTNDGSRIIEDIQWADIVWLEWAGPHAITITNHDTLLDNKKVIIRLHSSEAVNGYLECVKWSRINSIVFVAQHIMDIAMEKIVQFPHMLYPYLIPNSIDLDEWKFHEREDWYPDIAWAPGTIRSIKGPILAMQCMIELYKHSPGWKLHVAGTWAEERDRIYFEHMVKDWALEENIVMYGFVKGIQEWYRNMSFIASFSSWEGNPVAIMEAMATGLRPVIHNFKGSTDQYLDEWVWDTPSEFIGQLIQPVGDPIQYRDYVRENWNAEELMKSIDQVFCDIMETL